MTKDERAKISRENGAKSHGPVTPEGKDKVSMNALKTGEYLNKFDAFLPPHYATVCIEDRDSFDEHLDRLTKIYRPLHQLAHDIVRDIATARWQIERYNLCVTMNWDFALIDAGAKPLTIDPALVDMERNVRATHALLSGGAILARLNREIGRLQKQILFLEKHLVFVHKTFPPPPPEPADEAQKTGNKPSVYTDEIDPIVIAAYRRDFPNHNIVIVPASKDDDDDAYLPPLRKNPA